jgi:hypothetical protein
MVPKPPFPIAKMKTFRSIAEELENALAQGDSWGFYKKAELLLSKYTDPDERLFEKFDPEEVAAMYLWLSYFIATSPFLTYERHGNPGGNNSWSDIDIKDTTLSTNALLRTKIGTALKSKRTESQVLLLGYTQYTIDSFRLGLLVTKQIKEEIKAVRKQPTKDLFQKYASYEEEHVEKPYLLLQNLSAFWSRVGAGIESSLIDAPDTQVTLSISASNKSGTRLHELLAKGGYKDKDARHRILLKIAGRDKNTEWMYAGIPKSETKKIQEAYLLKGNAKSSTKPQDAQKQEIKKTIPSK